VPPAEPEGGQSPVEPEGGQSPAEPEGGQSPAEPEGGQSPAAASGCRILGIEGELTVHTAADRRGELIAMADAGDDVELDLSAVTELDTAGLQLLLLVRREVLRGGGRLTITAASRTVDDVLAIAHLNHTLTSVDDVVAVTR
jgi:anti-sigma B factor antagonist